MKLGILAKDISFYKSYVFYSGRIRTLVAMATLSFYRHNAPVICIHGPLGAGDIGDIAGLMCRNLTSDVSRQCRGCAGVLISR